MTDQGAERDLFQLGQEHFAAFVREFAGYGMQADPRMELRRGTGMLCYYDRSDGHIYLSIPDSQSPEGRLHWLLLRSALACKSNDEVVQLFELFLPFAIAHELGHHYRQRYGLFSDDRWYEEQVANQLAMAVVEHRLAPSDRARAAWLVKRAMDGLAAKLGLQGVAVDSFQSLWEALNVGGQIGDTQLRYLALTREFFGADMVDMLQSSGQLSEDIARHLERRESSIDEINLQYAAGTLRYMYYQLGWMYLELASPGREYAEEFARQQLRLAEPLLPLIAEESPADERAILACFKAYQDTLPFSEPGSRYFYKRYRSLLLARLQATAPAEQFRSGTALIYQTWEGQEGKDDMLALVAHLAPASLQALFPQQIAAHPELRQILPATCLPTDTDRRLWQRIHLGKEDCEASNVLARLALLEQIQIFRLLPAEVMLELCQELCRIKLAAGETVIWQGERNNDVYVLISGHMGAFDAENGAEEVEYTIKPGEVFGEMAFFTGEPRYTTIRALEPSECFVLKDADLHLLAYKHPIVLVEITRNVARRLAQKIDTV